MLLNFLSLPEISVRRILKPCPNSIIMVFDKQHVSAKRLKGLNKLELKDSAPIIGKAEGAKVKLADDCQGVFVVQGVVEGQSIVIIGFRRRQINLFGSMSIGIASTAARRFE